MKKIKSPFYQDNKIEPVQDLGGCHTEEKKVTGTVSSGPETNVLCDSENIMTGEISPNGNPGQHWQQRKGLQISLQPSGKLFSWPDFSSESVSHSEAQHKESIVAAGCISSMAGAKLTKSVKTANMIPVILTSAKIQIK